MNWSSFICLYERVRAIVKTCAEYMEYSESEVVDMLLLHILDDKDFINRKEQCFDSKLLMKFI